MLGMCDPRSRPIARNFGVCFLDLLWFNWLHSHLEVHLESP